MLKNKLYVSKLVTDWKNQSSMHFFSSPIFFPQSSAEVSSSNFELDTTFVHYEIWNLIVGLG